MSKKTRYFIETLPQGKINTWVIKNNKNKKFLTEYPNAKEVSQSQYNKTISILTNDKYGIKDK